MWVFGYNVRRARSCLEVQQSNGAAKSPPTKREGKGAVGGEVSDWKGCSWAAALAAEIVGRYQLSTRVYTTLSADDCHDEVECQ